MDSQEQMAFFHEIFDVSLPRLGPGDEASTLKALNMLREIGPEHEDKADPSSGRILDLGCGNGAQTIVLARHVQGSILALDNYQPYLDELQRRAETAGVSHKIRTSLRDTYSLDESDGPFDLIWSEGALFIMGFHEGLTACHRLLTPNGALAASELCWLTSDPPAECRQFFDAVYPAMTDVETSLADINACGYEVVGHFAQPESAWWEPFYHPLEERLPPLRKQYASDTEKLSMIEGIQQEIDIYRRYSASYSNVFFMMRRR